MKKHKEGKELASPYVAQAVNPHCQIIIMKCPKTLLAAAVAATMGATAWGADVSGTSAQDTSASTDVKYGVTEGYTWSIHSEIDFGKDAGVNQTVSKPETNGSSNTVSVTKNVIPDGKKLNISVKGSGTNGEFEIANGNTKLTYTISGNNSEITTGGTVFDVTLLNTQPQINKR